MQRLYIEEKTVREVREGKRLEWTLNFYLPLCSRRRQWHPTPVLLPGKSHGACWAAVHGVTRSQTRLSDFTFTFHFHALEKEMATHSSVLAWRIPGTEEPGGLLSMGSHRVRHDWSDLAVAAALEKEMATHSSVLAWRIPGAGKPSGLLSVGSHRVGHDWSKLAFIHWWTFGLFLTFGYF